MPLATRNGLAWDDSGLETVPVWTREPNLDAILNVCREKVQANSVSFFAEGAFNKLYLAQTNGRSFLFRVLLPVHPQSKTRGEVTTLRFLRRETDIPVPEVVAFDDSGDNEIGFEWILMELMPGVSLYKKWRSLNAFQKVALVQRIAEFQAQIFRHTFSGIGTLIMTDETERQKPQPGPLVSGMFFAGFHFDLDIPRGVFRSSHDWLSAYLEIAIADHTTAKEEAEDEEDEEDAEFALNITHRLISLLPKVFHPLQSPPERSVIWHQDLSLSNILINEQGEITAVIDWECVSAMPLWMATQTPKFLNGSTRDKEPKRATYGDENATIVAPLKDGKEEEEDELDNEGKNELYWIHLMEYETTQLRQSYNASMRQLYPGWDNLVEDSAFKQDFAGAVFRCAFGFHLKRISQWIDAIERGEFPRLLDVLQGPKINMRS
ncbi:phosphotransferase enzyme family-domain-containing protein [Aspergillus californicus]